MSEIAQDASRRKGMMSVSESGGGGGGGGGGGIRTSSSELGSEFASNPVITAGEAERLVESLEPFPLEEVGSEKWLKQHEVLEKLNMQAHHCARTNSDDFVLEALVTFDKLPTIIHELVVIEAWRENVFPLLEKDVVKRGSSMRAYFTLYHEATLSNLLESIFYHDYAAEAVGDAVIELIDWCARRLIYLNALPEKHSVVWAPEPKHNPKRKQRVEAAKKAKAAAAAAAKAAGSETKESAPAQKLEIDEETREEIKAAAAEMNKRTPEEDLRQQYLSVQFRVATASVTVMRYLCAQGSKLGVTVLSRLIDTHDVLTLVVPLIDNPPWTRRIAATGTWEKWVEMKWVPVPAAELLKLTKLEAQAWLTVYNLVSDKDFRGRYQFNGYRKDALLRVRKYINDVMVDQLPMFADVQRFMDELAIASTPAAMDSGTALVMEIMPEIRDAIMAEHGGKWADVAAEQLRGVFSGGEMDKNDAGLRALADLYSGDALANLMREQEMSPEDRRGALVTMSIKAYCAGNELTSVGQFEYKVERARPAPQSTSGGMFERYKLLMGPKSGGGALRPVPSDGTLRVSLFFEDGSMMDMQSSPMVLPGQQYVWPASSDASSSDIRVEVRSVLGLDFIGFCSGQNILTNNAPSPPHSPSQSHSHIYTGDQGRP
jgi:zinc finger MYND domain-containing protein 10